MSTGSPNTGSRVVPKPFPASVEFMSYREKAPVASFYLYLHLALLSHNPLTLCSLIHCSGRWTVLFHTAYLEKIITRIGHTSRILWNPNVQYRFRYVMSRVPILSQLHPAHAILLNLCKIHFNIILKYNPGSSKPVFLNRRAAARYRALVSIIPGRERFSWN